MDETPRQIDQVVRRSAPAALTGLFVLGLFYTAYFARAILVPVTMALLLALVLAPPVRGLRRRLRVPQPIAALLMVLSVVAVVVAAVYLLAGPAAQWMSQLPTELVEIERKLRPPRRPGPGRAGSSQASGATRARR
jgi:predicted PurR-regulated permease PerM